MAVKIAVGLGNPGPQYEATRHNAGRMLVEAFAAAHRLSLKDARGFLQARCTVGRSELLVSTLPTFMNESGRAVRHLLEAHHASPSDLIVLVDDFQIPVGSLRLRPSGSAGGHNGLQSTIDALSTDAFHRLRIGIGRPADDPAPPPKDWSDFVLRPFTPQEREALEASLARGVDALACWAGEGIEAAMNRFNN